MFFWNRQMTCDRHIGLRHGWLVAVTSQVNAVYVWSMRPNDDYFFNGIDFRRFDFLLVHKFFLFHY